MNEEIRKALHLFEQRTIRAWVLDTEDSYTDRDRKATKEAHTSAAQAKNALITLLTKESVV